MRPRPARFPILRPPPLRLVLVAALAVLVGALVHRTTADAADAAAALGDLRRVVVATRDLEPGVTIEASDIAMVERPVAHLPRGALGEDPTGRTSSAAIAAGEIVVRDRIAGEGRSGAAALVPEGWRAVAIPLLDAPIPVSPGDRVDVIGSFDPALSARDPSLVIAADAVVVAVTDEAVTVAVTRARVTDVAFALVNGFVTLALVG